MKSLEVDIINSSPDVIKCMWLAARNCYSKEIDNLEYNEDNAIKLLQNIYAKGHLSIFEQSYYQFYIKNASRSLLAQLTRHRVGFSFAVKSQHFQKHEDFDFKDLEQYVDDEHKSNYYTLMEYINLFYKNSLSKGIPRYIAREVLPNSCLTNIVMSVNLRALDNFWKLRKTDENTPEIRNLSKQLYMSVIIKDLAVGKIIKY
jgi:thymidylate synthase (FAD)